MTNATRTCIVPDCTDELPGDLPFCADHWTVVPHELKQRVFDAYNVAHGEAQSDEYYLAVNASLGALERILDITGPGIPAHEQRALAKSKAPSNRLTTILAGAIAGAILIIVFLALAGLGWVIVRWAFL